VKQKRTKHEAKDEMLRREVARIQSKHARLQRTVRKTEIKKETAKNRTELEGRARSLKQN
jgi:hypothetical protein